MAKKVQAIAVAPTIPFVEVPIGGKNYRLALDFEALAQAEAQLAAEGHPEVNLLVMLPRMNFSNLRILFAVGARKLQPELDYEDALRMVTFANMDLVGDYVVKLWELSTPKADTEAPKENPTQAGS